MPRPVVREVVSVWVPHLSVGHPSPLSRLCQQSWCLPLPSPVLYSCLTQVPPVLPLGCCSHSSHLLSLPLASCGTVSLFGAPAPSSLSLQPLALLPCSICNTVTKLSLRHTSDGFLQFLHHTFESFSRFFDSTKHVLFSLSLHACARPTFLWFINGTVYL